MTIVRDGGVRLTTLKSTFVGCAASPRSASAPADL